ncbi:MAG: helix-turn-helix domain-containing protein [Candidatus Competibacteraceae bacterium]|nr:helix-turn-helix domain-containing protein [Candidatus Competibacteraceae bacterium]MBK7982148.1 helix-turn-helix domain-containing protein [Candidatus Competibacteraceae bacterium]MBK8963338.1 helix-turn-helix domain-containing protein [Candidatus Competibacteraceae bacterium]
MNQPEPLLWSITETARQLGEVSARTVQRMIADGDLVEVSVRGRTMVDVASVRRYIENRRARARMEGKPCQEKIETDFTSSRSHRTGTRVIPMHGADAAAEVLERITKLRPRRS